MKRTIALMAALALGVTPVSAATSASSMRLMLTVPVRCTLDVVSGSVRGDALTIAVHRSCNTGHKVLLAGLQDQRLGIVSVTYNGSAASIIGDQVSLAQTEQIYDQTDIVVIRATGASAAELHALARSIQFAVVVA